MHVTSLAANTERQYTNAFDISNRNLTEENNNLQ